MRKQDFIETMNSFIKFQDFMSKLYDLTKWELFSIEEVENYTECYLNMLKELVKDRDQNFYDKDGNFMGSCSELDYFIGDLDCGRAYKSGMVKYCGEDIKLETPEDLWNYLVKLHPEIEKV